MTLIATMRARLIASIPVDCEDAEFQRMYFESAIDEEVLQLYGEVFCRGADVGYWAKGEVL